MDFLIVSTNWLHVLPGGRSLASLRVQMMIKRGVIEVCVTSRVDGFFVVEKK
jgi:hypothetical protein